jgi:hypothetical protein
VLAGAALSAGLTVSGCGAAVRAASVKTPSTFVAAPVGAPPEGIDLYSLATGRFVRKLVTDAIEPQTADGGRMVYFLRGPTTPGGCQYSVWKVATTGGPAHALGIRLNGAIMAVSPDGRFLAYASQPGGCHPVGPTYLTTIGLTSHQEHVARLWSPVESVAWSSNDRSVTVEGYGGPYGSPVVQVERDVWSAKPVQTSSHPPCPLNAPYCGQFYPQYDGRNDLFYIATVDPNPKRPCAVYRCTSQTYVLTEVRRGKALALARTSGRAGLGSWLAVSPSGTTAVYTVASGGSLHTFIWSAGNVRRAPALVSQENI